MVTVKVNPEGQEEEKKPFNYEGYTKMMSHREHLPLSTPTGAAFFNVAFVFYWIATAGSLAFLALVCYVVLKTKNFDLFMWHPLLMSLTLLLLTQGILLLQRTAKQEEKIQGLRFHRAVQFLGLLTCTAGFSIIVYTKIKHKEKHCNLHTSLDIWPHNNIPSACSHARSIIDAVQSRELYKYHRTFGYVILTFLWINALRGTQNSWPESEFNQLWAWDLIVFITLCALAARIKIAKVRSQVPQKISTSPI
ncbi:hypothetical protein G9A89_000272 [Geosiphon pyriformis]|nr:hypothetical protein G9A89_000272 [Geosiphon pyriformis]